MASEIPQNSRGAVDRAGRLLLLRDTSPEAVARAYQVVANWRAAHAFPLNTVTMDLRQKVDRLQGGALVVQRLKRARSILGKLAREATMRLSQMQDIGGCRAVVDTLGDVDRLGAFYSTSRSLHELVQDVDYIRQPKSSGYRSRHLVFRFKSRSRPEYDGLLLEIQLRSKLQHSWATAVETVGAVLGQALKASEGERDWLAFFRDASAAFAIQEGTPDVPGPSLTRGQLARSLNNQYRDLNVRRKLEAFRSALRVTSERPVKRAAYFLLVLRPETQQLRVRGYSRRSLEAANREYRRIEESLPMSPAYPQLTLFPELNETAGPQVVLVGADSLKAMRETYPNYYADTGSFLESIEGFIRRYKRSK